MARMNPLIASQCRIYASYFLVNFAAANAQVQNWRQGISYGNMYGTERQ